jgi:hypothetical protein
MVLVGEGRIQRKRSGENWQKSRILVFFTQVSNDNK